MREAAAAADALTGKDPAIGECLLRLRVKLSDGRSLARIHRRPLLRRPVEPTLMKEVGHAALVIASAATNKGV